MRSANCLLLASLYLFSCASGPALEKFPRRQIERPFTLPEGVASWTTLAAIETESLSRQDWTGRTNPLVWTQALSDRWNLIYVPIPLLAQFQISHGAPRTTGITMGFAGVGYGSASGLMVLPVLAYYHRERLSNDWAWVAEIAGTREISGRDTNGYFAGLISTGPFWQATPVVALQAFVRGTYADYDASGPFSAAIKRSDWNISFGGSVNYAVARQWSTSAQLISGGTFLPEYTETDALSVLVQLVHYW